MHKKEQLTLWKAKVAPKVELGKRAVAVVLRFEADEHACREARVAVIT